MAQPLALIGTHEIMVRVKKILIYCHVHPQAGGWYETKGFFREDGPPSYGTTVYKLCRIRRQRWPDLR
jgi:hypothetical protein